MYVCVCLCMFVSTVYCVLYVCVCVYIHYMCMFILYVCMCIIYMILCIYVYVCIDMSIHIKVCMHVSLYQYQCCKPCVGSWSWTPLSLLHHVILLC